MKVKSAVRQWSGPLSCYRQLPIEQVETELQRVHDSGGNPEQVFLGDGNAFCMSTDHLLRILELVHRYLPGCRMVNMDATITNISQKSDEELKQLYDLSLIHISEPTRP